MRTRTVRTGAVCLTVAATLLSGLLSGCKPSLTSGNTGFVTGDGTVSVLPAERREQPKGEVAGTTVEGKDVSLADYAGKVVVMPVWGSWCGPCRKEAPGLSLAAKDLAGKGVVFLGLNTRDRNEVDVRSFVDRFRLSYDSIYDEDGQTLLAFRGTLPPMTIPSFVVIDRQGRVAARILGPADLSTLYGVIEDVSGEKLRVPQEAEG